MSRGAPGVEERLGEEGMEVVHLTGVGGSVYDTLELVDVAKQKDASCVVVDGYNFGADYQRIIKKAGLQLVFVDDNGHADHYWADLVLNQNIHAHEGMYTRRENYTHLLLGTRYALVRREFLKWKNWGREIPQLARKVLVTLGGSDPHNFTLKVMQALQGIDVKNLEAAIVVGGSNPHYDELQLAMQASNVSLQLHRNVLTMPELMGWADVGVAAAGSTCWELAFMGLPSCLGVVSENQLQVAEVLHGRRVAINIGWFRSVDQCNMAQEIGNLMKNRMGRWEMSQQGRRLVNGYGAQYVVKTILTTIIRIG
jgi:UDP-2,4-diacetamido-2,4,6-trideoxy-beta-L-altropyranose hydrolase